MPHRKETKLLMMARALNSMASTDKSVAKRAAAEEILHEVISVEGQLARLMVENVLYAADFERLSKVVPRFAENELWEDVVFELDARAQKLDAAQRENLELRTMLGLKADEPLPSRRSDGLAEKLLSLPG